MSYIAEIETRVAGIPCIVGVVEYNCVKGSYSYHAASDWDYYGYTDLDYVILDRRGRPAAWLERKLDDDMRADIEREIAEYFN
jgi:hypothetical protein